MASLSQTMSASPSSLPSSHKDVFRQVLSDLSDTPIDEDTLTHFLSILDTKFRDSNLQITTSTPHLTVQEVRANFAVQSKDDSKRWEGLKTSNPELIAQWKALAPRIALKAGGTRKLTGYDAFRLFKGVLPPIGDGVSPIARP